MNPEETLNKIKEQNRERAKRYYLKNKVIITERQKKNKLFIPQLTKTEPSARTIAFYNDTLKTLNKILGESIDYKKHKNIIKKINDASHNNILYSTNSKKNFYQLILKMISENKIKMLEDQAKKCKSKLEKNKNIMESDKNTKKTKLVVIR